MKIVDLTGKQFGDITVLNITDKRKGGKIVWRCKCNLCGKEFYKDGDSLKYKNITNCGCFDKSKGHGKKNKINKYIKIDNYYIGYTSNTNKEYYVDEDDYDKIKNYTWSENDSGYVVSRINNKIVRMHRYILDIKIGDKRVVDHINHNTLDNRKINLRIVNKSENNMNKKSKGYIYDKTHNKYHAYISKNYKRKFLGYFEKEEDAINARKKAEDMLFGEYGYNNSIKINNI